METTILPNMELMRDISNVSYTDRLFYELGYKNREGNWIRRGVFKEIQNIKEFINGDKRLSDLEYLDHHNFMIIKN